MQTPKAKRKKSEKIDNQRKQNESIKTGVPCTVAPKATATKSIKQVKTLLNSAKVADSSSKSEPFSGMYKYIMTCQLMGTYVRQVSYKPDSISAVLDEIGAVENNIMLLRMYNIVLWEKNEWSS